MTRDDKKKVKRIIKTIATFGTEAHPFVGPVMDEHGSDIVDMIINEYQANAGV